MDDVASIQPVLPKLSTRDLVLRESGTGWLVEDASGRQICETLTSIAEARLIGRTFVPARGRVWVCQAGRWAPLDDD